MSNFEVWKRHDCLYTEKIGIIGYNECELA